MIEPINTAAGEGADLAEVEAALGPQVEGVCQHWAGAMRSELGRTADDLTDLMLSDARAVLAEVAGLPPLPAEPIRQRGGVKSLHFTLRMRDVLAGYGLLRHVMLQQIFSELGRDLRREEALGLHRRFDQAVAQRASAMADAQLDELRAVGEAQAKYMSFLSHDLRGSLNGLILMLEVMRRELEPRKEFSETLADLLMMRKSVMDTVVTMERHMLAERLRRGRVEVKPRPVNLASTIGGIVGDMARLTQEKNTQVLIEAPQGGTVMADQELLQTVIHNLIENAVKHGQGPVRVRAQRVNGQWSIAVSDGGPGMAPDRLERFLDPVKRVELREKGMGLTITQYAARLLGGRVDGQSDPSGGTTMTLILPESPSPL